MRWCYMRRISAFDWLVSANQIAMSWAFVTKYGVLNLRSSAFISCARCYYALEKTT